MPFWFNFFWSSVKDTLLSQFFRFSAEVVLRTPFWFKILGRSGSGIWRFDSTSGPLTHLPPPPHVQHEFGVQQELAFCSEPRTQNKTMLM